MVLDHIVNLSPLYVSPWHFILLWIYRSFLSVSQCHLITMGIYLIFEYVHDNWSNCYFTSSLAMRFYWPFQGGTSFVDLLCFCSVLCLLCFVRVCLYVLRGHLLGKGWPLGSRLWCLLWVCHFPIGILGQVWYLIVSIPDLCNLTYFDHIVNISLHLVSQWYFITCEYIPYLKITMTFDQT